MSIDYPPSSSVSSDLTAPLHAPHHRNPFSTPSVSPPSLFSIHHRPPPCSWPVAKPPTHLRTALLARSFRTPSATIADDKRGLKLIEDIRQEKSQMNQIPNFFLFFFFVLRIKLNQNSATSLLKCKLFFKIQQVKNSVKPGVGKLLFEILSGFGYGRSEFEANFNFFRKHLLNVWLKNWSYDVVNILIGNSEFFQSPECKIYTRT